MLRVITGKAKGRKLEVPSRGTRPLTDRIKVSIFDLIRDFIEGAIVLDLFAGSGTFGIECLSRGAKYADFVDLGGEACEIISRNLYSTKLYDQASIHQTHSHEFIANTQLTYDIIFSDAPFDIDLDLDLEGISRIINDDGIIIVRIEIVKELLLRTKKLELVYEKQYGKSRVFFLKKVLTSC